MRTGIAAAVVAGAAATMLAAPAHADAPRYAELRSPTVAYGPACAGQVFAQFTSARVLYPGPNLPPKNNRGIVRVSVGGNFFGISDRAGMPCRVHTIVRWRNLRSGSSGVVAGRVSGTLIPPVAQDLVSASPRTGSGPVEFTLTTARPHLVERTVLNVW
ncbi:hypothetical protein L5G32_09345 [Gordonia sp. HY002]|uniref:hypothetical protein n=1 Tax=Gordonia zhenghanii TaxID=2911516 RepID=UPI001EF0E7EA|nr:hypothetical protein [Gordonia zhenghanii]MCF8570470.1 hypothetical protein [Gordonia zhenghanii]MCF8602573.1 hypothetical protein [Gordonia zhenghanii]